MIFQTVRRIPDGIPDLCFCLNGDSFDVYGFVGLLFTAAFKKPLPGRPGRAGKGGNVPFVQLKDTGATIADETGRRRHVPFVYSEDMPFPAKITLHSV
jgi:hypothetical protein